MVRGALLWLPLCAALFLLGSGAALGLDFGRKFEPRGDRVIHGAGQSPDAFDNYWNAIGPNKPALFMTYCGLNRISQAWFMRLAATLDRYPGTMPQIGLSLGRDGRPEEHYEHRVAAGEFDEQIAVLCRGLKSLGRPVFLRIGYEFNGPWNGYAPETYIAAWRRLVNAFRERGVDNVATLWCFAPGGRPNYMDFYPGDDYVDWWSIDLFSPRHFTAAITLRFTRDALEHKHPIIIGESTPRHVGVLEGEKSWETWFAPYFRYIRDNPHVKGFCYINWDWAKYPRWADWGDCRIERNEVVRARFEAEMRDPRYIHAMPQSEFLKLVFH